MDISNVFEVLSKDLASLQASLNRYEEMLFTKTEKPGTVKELVDYYRHQALNVRQALLKLCVVLDDEMYPEEEAELVKKPAPSKTAEAVEVSVTYDDEEDPLPV